MLCTNLVLVSEYTSSLLQSNTSCLLALALSALHVHHAAFVTNVQHALGHVLLLVFYLFEPLLSRSEVSCEFANAAMKATRLLA